MSGNSTIERWLDIIDSDDGRSTVRAENDRYADRRDESADRSLGEPSQALHTGSTSRHRVQRHNHRTTAHEMYHLDMKDSTVDRLLPINGSSPHGPYSGAASQSNLPRPFSSAAYATQRRYRTPSPSPPPSPPPRIRISRQRPLFSPPYSPLRSQSTFTPAARFQTDPGLPSMHHRNDYTSTARPDQYTGARGAQIPRFRTAEGNDAYRRFLRSGAGEI
ncbi:uncharacterized protein EAF02_011784 [Botrytis sinoallii]|uniref:uncharacterized protein n=1 Tax=Botrytis sinoallii TaxID=1463999 RepID=UPI00190211B7|nr:uncharacterized protein EAF02_011784 [Botrytis sinoallii]KAF7853794.1 hypothetical protein EAF02_011784 [Botrytis sinoallii]